MALSAPTAWLVLEYHGKKAWKKTLGSWNQHCREWCEQSINQSLMHPYPQLMMIITIIIIQKKRVQTKSSVWVVLLQAGKGMFKLNGTQLVFLQVPAFKELQAFLHCQAFLQTLDEEQEKNKRLRIRPNAEAKATVRGRKGGG